MSLPKLTYFNGRGNGELPRLIFALAGVKYEDNRVSDLSPLKASGILTFNQVPLLEIDGISFVQSHAIGRFLSRKFGLYGADIVEASRIDEVLDGLYDLRNRWMPVREATVDKEAKLEEFKSKTLPHWLAFIDKRLGSNEFFVGSKPTLADVQAFNALWTYNNVAVPGCLDAFPNLKNFYERFAAIPNIAKWLEERPKTAF